MRTWDRGPSSDTSVTRHAASTRTDWRAADRLHVDAAGCDMPVGSPVWIGFNGVMWFGPDSAASLYRTQCLGQFEGG